MNFALRTVCSSRSSAPAFLAALAMASSSKIRLQAIAAGIVPRTL